MTPGEMESTAWKPGHMIDKHGNAISHLHSDEQNIVDIADSLIYHWMYGN